jgi:integrase/recombinase XerD
VPAPTSLDRAIDEFLTYLRVERGLSAATLRAYRSDLETSPRRAARPPGWDRNEDAAVRYLASRARRGRPRDPGLAPTSLRRRAASIRGFYRFAYGEGLISVDVAQHIDLPRQPRLLPDTLTIEEVESLLEAAPDLRARALLELLYAAGLRVSEATGLDLEDLSLDGGFVRVIGKGDRERLVPVGDVAIDWLRQWLDDGRPLLLELGHAPLERGGPLFLGDRGGRLARQQAFAIVRAATKAAGLRGRISPHTLRHSFATHLSRAAPT